MDRKFLIFTLCSVLGSTAFAAPGLDPFKVNLDGSLAIGSAGIALVHFNPSWKASEQSKQSIKPEQGNPEQDAQGFRLRGDFSVAGGVFQLNEKIAPRGTGTVAVSLALESSSGIPANDIGWCLTLPAADFAGKTFTVNGKTQEFPLLFDPNRSKLLNTDVSGDIEIQFQDFKLSISGATSVIVQDDRQFNRQTYAFRLRLAPSKGTVKSSRGEFVLAAIPYDTAPLDMRKAANFGFHDDVAEDGKGGWTDQGPEFSFPIEPGAARIGGVRFDIIDPASNNGRACMVLGKKRISGAMKRAELRTDARSARYLCVLHAVAWPPNGKKQIGTIQAKYADGSSQTFPVANQVDVGNWWNPVAADNANLAWTGSCRNNNAGLFLACLPLDAGKSLTGIVFENDGDSAWMVVALATSNDEIPRQKAPPYLIEESDEWKPIPFTKKVEKGSALDFSRLLDAPAGKHGRLLVKGDQFVFEDNPARPVRFYGANLCFSANFLNKPECDELADRLAGYGYNSIRFHHYDNGLVSPGSAGAADPLDAENLDRLDYLFAALKKRGIYITTDFYTSREIRKGEIPEIDRPITLAKIDDYKALVVLLDSARRSWKAFAGQLLSHVNPYTGLAWKDDPALIFAPLVNEGNIHRAVKRCSPDVKEIFKREFEKWLAKTGRGDAPATPAERDALENRFLCEANRNAFLEMRGFVRSLGAKMPVSDQNMLNYTSLSFMRNDYDYVDTHFYWNHPSFPVRPWALPSSHQNTSSTKFFAVRPGDSMATRLFGKPFTVTEFNFCFPNSYRSEGGVLTAAYASLQGWNALYRFAFSHNKSNLNRDTALGFFDVVADPVSLLSDRIGMLLFLRGDVSPSQLEIPIAAGRSNLDNVRDCPDLAWQLGLVGKVGTVVEENGSYKLPDSAKACLALNPAETPRGVPVIDLSAGKDASGQLARIRAGFDFGKGYLDLGSKAARSSTGELELDGRAGNFQAVTSKSETFVFSGPGRAKGVSSTVENRKTPSTIMVASLDDKPLPDSSRLLILHLTDICASGTKFADAGMTFLESSGHPPIMARNGKAEIRLSAAPRSGAPQVYALDLSGRRIGRVPTRTEADGATVVPLDTFAMRIPCMAYEVVR